LLTTRGLVLENKGYGVLTAQTFSNAMLALMNHQIDIVVLCQSLTDEHRRGILETAHALQPEVRCAVLDSEASQGELEGADLIRGMAGPSTLLNAIENILRESTCLTS
jgi:DNA-binding response OmpR family regulator